MRFGKHVFISFAHIDNHGASPGWISRFHGSLDRILSMRLGRKAEIWRDEKLRGNDVFADEIVSHLPDAAVLVSVVSPRYVLSEWCLREAATFCEVGQRPPGLVIGNKSRVFKVILMPPDSQDPLPAPMRDTLGFDFYVRVKPDMSESHDEQDPVLELDPCYSADLERKFNAAVARLAWDIAQTLRHLEAPAATAAPIPASVPQASAPGRPGVYLAECGYDRREDREALRSELAMRGYPVLPDRPLPQDEAEYRAEVARLLERCALAIHLVGSRYGAVPDGLGKDSVVVIQNDLAVQRARSAGLLRVVSLPAGTRSDDARQQAFIEAMHRVADAQFGADLITADRESVKSAVRAALARIEAPPPAAPAGPEGAATLYVIFDERDRKATVPLRRSLTARGLAVQTPVFEGDAAEVRRANQERLTQCDAVLVFYGSGTEAWKASVDSEVRKAAALRPGRPLRAVFTWLGEPATGAKADAIDMAEPDLIDGLRGFSEPLVEPIVTALRGGGGG